MFFNIGLIFKRKKIEMLRKIASLTSLISFLVTLLTSGVLYIVPPGRIAYWVDWRFMGLSKTEWSNLHINIGVLFIVAVLFHTCFNLNSIFSYLRDNERRFHLFAPTFTASIVIVAVCALGSYIEIPPFSTINDYSETIKGRAARFYGEPPYGHAELSPLKTFLRRMGLEPGKSIARLESAGIIANEEQSLLAIAKKNNTTPEAIFRILHPKE